VSDVLTGRRGIKRLTLPGLPALLAVGIAFPVLTPEPSASPAYRSPSKILCGSWVKCNMRGYDSYGYGANASRAYWRMSPGDECTNYAAYVESTVYHVPAPSYLLGNASQWPGEAAAHGVPVNHTPSVGAVAVWDAGTFGIGAFGHVGVVEQVGPGDSYIVISQQHMGSPYDYNWTLIKAHYPADEWQEWPSSFIHFRIPARAGIGYFDPRTGGYALRDSLTAGPASRTGRLWLKGAVPLSGDWLGTGTDSLGFYSPRYGIFHLLGARRAANPDVEITVGPPRMVPLVGDWYGTGRDSIGFYDRASGVFTLRRSLTDGGVTAFRFGRPGMVPLAGDWTGGRRDGVGYYNPATGIFNLRNTLSTGAPWVSFKFGPPHMIPIVGNWTGLGRKDGVGYYDPRTGTFHLRDRLSAGLADVVARFGPPGMVPLTGDWLGG